MSIVEGRSSAIVRLEVLDTIVELLVVGDDQIIDAVEHAWSRCLVDHAGPADVVLVVRHGAAPPTSADLVSDNLDGLLHHLSPLVTRAAIGHQAGRLLMLHACALARADGRVVALVAPSGTGKTTACLALGAHYGYVTDETVAIRDDLSVAAYPKPLSVTIAGRAWKEQRSPADAGLAPAPVSGTLAAIAILARDGSVEPWLEPVPTVRAIALLGPESSYLSRLYKPLHLMAGIVNSVGGLCVLHYAEASDLEPMIESLLEEG